jgi:hypothetical protein
LRMDAHIHPQPDVRPHHYNRNSRVFDVTIQHADRGLDAMSGTFGFTIPVVANSFSQASVAAVDHANARLNVYREQQKQHGWADSEFLDSIRDFAAVDVVKMEVVRTGTTVFRHAQPVS